MIKRHIRWQVFASIAINIAAVCVCAAAQDNDAAAATKAAKLARTELQKQLQIDIGSIEVISTTAQTWPDSSLGCGAPGTQAAQVITPGYEVLLKTPRGNYRVHAANKYAVVCGNATQWRNPRSVGLPLKNLNDKIEAARADLAKKLNAPPNEIRTVTFTAAEWPDTSMECVIATEPVVKKLTKGYRIALRYAGRVYTYHTDMDRVRACPAIEVD